MRIIKRTTLAGYWRRHADAETPLRQWLAIARLAEWTNILDVRQTFPHADAVEARSGNTVTVFNIGGNDYRLVVSIKYRWGVVYIRDFLTHAEYDKDSWKNRH
jgi:mRNA interferase HigB